MAMLTIAGGRKPRPVPPLWDRRASIELVEEEVEDEEEDADQLDKRGGVNKIAQGHARSKAVKATSVAGQRRRAVASARKQHKVFDPGVRW